MVVATPRVTLALVEGKVAVAVDEADVAHVGARLALTASPIMVKMPLSVILQIFIYINIYNTASLPSQKIHSK